MPPTLNTARMLRLAASAFVVLAAEPSFVLIDTAVVGHLGPLPLGALGIGGTLLSLVAMIGAFLDYGTTGRAARLVRRRATRPGGRGGDHRVGARTDAGRSGGRCR
jgi:Na+-driven multidrug efflux pump